MVSTNEPSRWVDAPDDARVAPGSADLQLGHDRRTAETARTPPRIGRGDLEDRQLDPWLPKSKSALDRENDDAGAPAFANIDRQLGVFETAAGPLDWRRLGVTPGFNAWLLGVSQVTAEDQELGVIWNAALLALLDGGPERFRILRIAERMTNDDAAAFWNGLRHPDDRVSPPRGQDRGTVARRLRRLGLLSPRPGFLTPGPALWNRKRLSRDGARLASLINRVQTYPSQAPQP
ncbi:hypothetical protein [Phenylobacterium sp.]|uniref:hypothetical protein n=1 Tax=Phenylobacterium sp. TaxID=1871053 RepID=UPI0012138012|nr:hypothetical protein [Phenylobacterium sp.]THD59289.1 MAG: hypothetical protein E8A49_16915 [Phenylobacterium sp.]